MRSEKPGRGTRALRGPNPFVEMSDLQLAGAAGRLVEELLEPRARSPEERRELAERCTYMLILCNQRLMRTAVAGAMPYAGDRFYPPDVHAAAAHRPPVEEPPTTPPPPAGDPDPEELPSWDPEPHAPAGDPDDPAPPRS